MNPRLLKVGALSTLSLGLATSLLLVAPSLINASDYGSLKKAADQLYYNGKYEEARAAYLKANVLNDKDPELYLKLGEIELRRANFKEGASSLEKAKSLDPKNPEIHLSLGAAYLDQAQFDEAIAELKETLRLQSTNLLATEYLGGAYYRTGRLAEALQTLVLLKELTPESYAAREQLGQMFSEKGEYEKAKTEFQKVIELAPSYPNGYGGLAGLEAKTGHPDKAIELYERAVELSPRDFYYYFNLGYLYLEQGAPAKALEALTKALEISPNHLVATEYKEAAEKSLGRTKERPNVQCYPDVPKPQLKLVGTERSIGADGKAYTYYNIEVTNWSAFPAELFMAAPDLPPCGKNMNAARTWTYVHDPQGRPLKASCGAIAKPGFKGIYTWFAIEKGGVPPDSVFISLQDRRCDIQYVSNSVRVTSETTQSPTKTTSR